MQDVLVHHTVLLNEAVEALSVQPGGAYIDGTFGRGGHSRLVLSRLAQYQQQALTHLPRRKPPMPQWRQAQ